MSYPSKIRVLTLTGSPKERGQIHGETLKHMILEIIERYKYHLHFNYHKNPDQLIDFFVSNTNFLSAVKKWTPILLEEIEGIAEGVGVDFKEIFALQMAAHDEGWWFFQKSTSFEKCSSIGCFREKDQPALVAQNLDLPNLFEGSEVLLRIKHDDSSLEAYVLSHAGFLGEFGMNNHPIGICCNSMSNFLNNSPNGLPFTFIIRTILEQSSLEKAVKFIYSIQHASAQNYIIGGLERVISLECSANNIIQFEPFKDARRVYHTNHPIKNNDVIIPPLKPIFISTSYDRFNYLESRLRDPSKIITVNTIKNILSSHFGPVCVHHNNQPNSGYTYSSGIYELASRPSLYITVGPPCLTEYERFEF